MGATPSSAPTLGKGEKVRDYEEKLIKRKNTIPAERRVFV
jgi:hypothetical protein